MQVRASARRVLLALLLVLAVASGVPAETPSLSAEQARELETLRGQLLDPDRSDRTKQDAAELLLARGWPQAVQALQTLLEDASNPAAQLAVAEAVAVSPAPPAPFVPALMNLLETAEDPLRSAAARALARYRSNGVAEKLIAIARDAERPVPLRLAVVEALQRVLDKRAVDTLVGLLEDPDEQIRRQALQSLANLTNLRAFGEDRKAWRQWWEQNRDKPTWVWLVNLADSLSVAKASLESELDRVRRSHQQQLQSLRGQMQQQNLQLRRRVVKLCTELYDQAGPARQEQMLAEYLADPLPSVRHLGLSLVERRLASGQKLGEAVPPLVLNLLDDEDARVRRSAALLSSVVDGTEAGARLLGRLSAEPVDAVREAILTALGQLQDARAVEAAVVHVAEGPPGVAAAASRALQRIVAAHPPEAALRTTAVQSLTSRWNRLREDGSDDAVLREALLSAMGALRDEAFVPALESALADPHAMVRLAAVNGLREYGRAASTEKIAPLVADPDDRGVRGAALLALGEMGGYEHVEAILRRTDPAVEKDAEVRRRAWQALEALIDAGDAKQLGSIAAGLDGREDARDARIRLWSRLVELSRPAGGAEHARALSQLSKELLAAGRPAEALKHLAELHGLYAEAGDGPAAAEAWQRWVEAMILANSPDLAERISRRKDPAAIASAMDRILEHLARLESEGRSDAAVELARRGLAVPAESVPAEKRAAIQAVLSRLDEKQRQAEREKVARLAEQLLAEQKADRAAAEQALAAMGPRAVEPLLRELREALRSDPPRPELEAALLEMLERIAPQLQGYDPAADRAQRLKQVDLWLQGV